MTKITMFSWIGFLAISGLVTQITAWNIRCTLSKDGHMGLFKGRDLIVDNDKLVLLEWNPGPEDCKFKVVANLQGGYSHSSIAVGPHQSPDKYFRFLDFDRYDGQVSQRGWRCKAGCKGPITTFDYDVVNPNGTVYATVKEIDPGMVYVIESALCQGADKPNYKFTYHFDVPIHEDVIVMQLDGDFFFNHESEMSGICSED